MQKQGFFQGGRGGSIRPPPPLEAGCPPLRGPPVTYSYSITFDIVHVESFPLLMAKAVLNECFALLNFRAPRRRKQSLSVFYSFCYLSSSIYICTGTLHTLYSRFKSVNRSRFLFTGLAFPAELSNYICYCTWSQKPLEAVSEAANIKIFLGEHAQIPLV